MRRLLLLRPPPRHRRLLTTGINEFRHNLATDEWVVFSAARRSRPTQYASSSQVSAPRLSDLPAHDETCPFCKGNEQLTPPATLTRLLPGTAEDDNEWTLRVVPNKFPAVAPSGTAAQRAPNWRENASDPNQLLTVERVEAVGFHEVLIESPQHNVPTALASPEQVEGLVRALRSRGRSMIASDPTLRHIMYFKNSGLKAGASLLHPHSQILGLPIVPNEVVRRQRHAREWFLRFQRNVFELTIEQTLRERDEALAAAAWATSGGGEVLAAAEAAAAGRAAAAAAAGGWAAEPPDVAAAAAAREAAARGEPPKHRVLLENEHLVCFVPFAALSPFSLWIVPKAPAAHFHEASDELVHHFAAMLRQALRKLHFGLGEPDFNMVIRSAALERRGHAIYRSELFFRWYCLIIPRLGVGAMGGFEFSTGIQSHSSLPEEDAAFLRSVVVPDG
jgi:galactose-1-phosphate uridylyltransferase